MASTINVGILRALLTADTAQFDSAMNRAGKSAESFSKVMGTLKGAFAAWGIKQLVSDAVSFGSQLTDLSAQTGIGVEALQRLDAAGRMVGVGLDQAARGINAMQRNLIGDKGAQQAVAALGLSVKDLLAQEPDQAFIDIAREIAKIPDPAVRTAVAIEVLGKSGQTLLPLLLSDIQKLGKGTQVMSADVVAALDTFDDTWADVSRAAQASIGTLIGSLGSLDGVLRLLSANPFMGGTGDVKGAKNITGFVDAIRGLYELPAVAPPALDAIPAAAGATGEALDQMAAAQLRMNAETEKAVKEAEAYNTRINAIVETLSGQALAAKVNDLAAAYGRLTSEQLQSKGTQDALVKQVMELKAQGAKLPPVLQDIWRETALVQFHQLAAARSTKTLTQNLEEMIASAPKPVFYAEIFERGARAMRDQAIPSLQQMVNVTQALDRDTRLVGTAWDTLGVRSQASLDKQAEDARKAYADIVRYGNATRDDLIRAREAVEQAEIEAGQRTVSIWREQIVPGIQAAWTQMKDHAITTLGLMLTGQQSFKEGMLSIWGAIKQALFNTFNEILSAFINGLLKRMIAGMIAQQPAMSAAWGTLFTTSGTGGTAISLTNPASMSAAGSTGGGAVAAGMSSALYAGAATYGLYKFWDIVVSRWTGGPSPERFPRVIGIDEDTGAPVIGVGIEQPEYERRYPGEGSNPNAPIDPNTGLPMPEFSPGQNTPNFQHGTHGRFPDFGTGTPVMLHGREAVVPYNERSTWSAEPFVIHNHVYLDGREAAEAIFPYTPKVAERHRVARR